MKRLEVEEMKMCRWACGHTLRLCEKLEHQGANEDKDHRQDHESEKTEVVWACRDENKNMWEDEHWRWHRPGEEEEEEDQSRDG